MMLEQCGIAVDLCPIHSTENILEVWPEFGILPDVIGGRIVDMGELDVTGVKARVNKNVEYFLEISKELIIRIYYERNGYKLTLRLWSLNVGIVPQHEQS